MPTIPERDLQLLSTLTEGIDSVESVYLIGSGARGELSTYRADNGKVRLLSDYELFIVAKGAALWSRPRLMRILQARKRSLEERLGYGPPFHIDFQVVSRWRLPLFPRRFFTWELRECGVLLRGEDLRTRIPSVTLSTLDYRELNEVLIWRLFTLLRFRPSDFGPDWEPADAFARASYEYVVAKNALDITTWLVPRLGRLLAGYEARVGFLLNSEDPVLAVWYEDLDLKGLLASALDRKLRPGTSRADGRDIYSYYLWTVRALLRSVLLMTGISPPVSGSTGNKSVSHRIADDEMMFLLQQTYSLLSRSHGFFRSRTPIRVLRDFRRIPRVRSKAALKWLLDDKLTVALCVCIALHLEFIAENQGPEEAKALARRIVNAGLARLTANEPTVNESRTYLVHETRLFFERYFPWVSPLVSPQC